METTTLRFQKHYELAYRSATGTSFSPEKRANSIIQDYSEQLESDLNDLRAKEADSETLERYISKHETLFTSWLSAKGNCISSMITGGSNFPVTRAEKANNRESVKYKEFQEFRTLFFDRIAKQQRKQAVIDAGGELEIAKNKLAFLLELQAKMKRINKAHSAFVKNPNSIIESGLSEAEQDFVIKWVPKWVYYTKPFQAFELTNNNAKIKNTEFRVKQLEGKEVLKNSNEPSSDKIIIPGGYLILNYTADRIQIFNDERPERIIIESYKKHGLKWSNFNKCWQRQITENAKYSLNSLFKIKI